MQDIKNLTKMWKHNTLCDIIRKEVKLIYSGEGCPEEQLGSDNTITGMVIKVDNDEFDFEFKNGSTATLAIDKVDGFELQ